MGIIKRIACFTLTSFCVLSLGALSAWVYTERKYPQNETVKSENVKTVLKPEKLMPNADFEYQLYNEETGITDTVHGECPYELYGMGMNETKEYYSDWNLLEFMPTKVVLRKNTSLENPERYVVGIYDGCVAVFYENSEEGIYLLTDIPVVSIDEDRRKRLKEGIYVEGRERLNRILEDYGS